MSLDAAALKHRFPALNREGTPFCYLDSAATTHKPDCVLDLLDDFNRRRYATIHRGVYRLSEEATLAYEGVRKIVADHIGASSEREIVFTKGTTESINLVASSFGRRYLKEGDEVVVSALEHHSNIVPWQMACEEKGAKLRVIPMNDAGELDLEAYTGLLSAKTRLVAVNHVSNALGTINPVRKICAMAREVRALSLVDGAQSTAHLPIDVRAIGCDFYAFSGHKVYGPTGVGILYGRYAVLEKLPPYQGGGDMIESVSFEGTRYLPPPQRFEAGTPPIAEVIGLGRALAFLKETGLAAIEAQELELLAYGTRRLAEVEGLRLVGTAREKAGILSFVMDRAHPHDIASILAGEGVCIRAGHHCAQPVMDRLGIPATARASLALYNTHEDIDTLVRALEQVNKVFS
ncbi:MAG: cysteine desulfurase [Planctomycetes bacterium]|nr:cysteine desulfurase [Planctomycetota bacterium]